MGLFDDEHPILNSSYDYPSRYWELDDQGQPTQNIIDRRRRAEFITPIPKPRKRKGAAEQQQMVFDEGKGLSSKEQQYDPTQATATSENVSGKYKTDIAMTRQRISDCIGLLIMLKNMEEEPMSMLFTPILIKDMQVRNRIVMPPMCQYSAGNDGVATDWHLVHYATRAVGGVGLIIVEATAVEPRGRISDNDLGLWSDEQIPMLKRIVDNVHKYGAKIGIQLAHAGRKSESASSTPVAPSPIPFTPDSRNPGELNRSEIKEIQKSFAYAAKRVLAAGFDMIEVHAAHGYLINEFLSPVSNKRNDGYGGSLENRVRFLRETLEEVGKVWLSGKPVFVRVSAVDYIPGGIDLDEMLRIVTLLKDCGVDLWHVSSGGIAPANIDAYPGFQVHYASEIRNRLNVKTATVGAITTPEMAESILASGHADMIALGRELLRNPYWPLTAARELGVEVEWPKQYERAKK